MCETLESFPALLAKMQDPAHVVSAVVTLRRHGTKFVLVNIVVIHEDGHIEESPR